MPHFERIRDVVAGQDVQDMLQQRRQSGWQLVSLDWRRELPGDEPPSSGAFAEEIPYGLRIADDGQRLEVDTQENLVLLQMMQMLAQDFSYSSIVGDLNEKGFRTRDGRPWTRISVFNMIPRLIEVGPRMFSSKEWEERRRQFAKMI